MKVSSLIYRLKKLPQDKEIMISKDSEGNQIFANVDIDRYDVVPGEESYCIFPDESTVLEGI